MPRRRPSLISLMCAAALLASGGLLRCTMVPDPAPSPPPASVTALLGGDDAAGFARATAPRAFRFPYDNGPHPEFRHEWWYFTGNLRGTGGRRFGYQLNFFRFASSPDPPGRGSRWATNEADMAHLGITDLHGWLVHHFDRTGR